MANALLVWDNNQAQVEKLCSLLAISSKEDTAGSLEDLKTGTLLRGREVILILLETDIDEKSRGDLYGLQLIKFLRKEARFRGLIIALSFFDARYFKTLKGAEILFTSGTRLKPVLEERFDPEDMVSLARAVPKLSDDLLDDIIFSAFDIKGRIHELLHQLKNELNVSMTNSRLDELLEQQQHIFMQYRTLIAAEIDPKNSTEFTRLFHNLAGQTALDLQAHWDKRADIGPFSYTNAGTQVNRVSAQIAAYAPVTVDQPDRGLSKNVAWEALFFDDSKEARDVVEGYFAGKDVTCHLAGSEAEVFELLKKHEGRIALFISDIRLIDEAGNWADRQGYDVVDRVNKTCKYPLVYTILTSKNGTINQMIQKKRSYQILWFSKDDVINNPYSFNVFFDQVQKYADEVFTSFSLFQPQFGYWNKKYKGHYHFPLMSYYKHHKESHGYREEELLINRKTMDWLFAAGVKYDWMAKLLKPDIDETELKKFRNTKLLGRRIALACAARGDTTSAAGVYNFMTGHAKSKVDSSVKTFFSKLGLSTHIEDMVDQAYSFFKGDGSTISILYEEYELLKQEFFEEKGITVPAEDVIGLKGLFNQIEGAFESLNLTAPVVFYQVKELLWKNCFPKAARLRLLFSELKDIDGANEFKLLKEAGKNNFLNTTRNAFLKDVFRENDLI